MLAILKLSLYINLVAALIAGPMMLFAPATYVQGNMDAGAALGDTTATLVAAGVNSTDHFHIRFVGAAVFVCGISLVGQALFLISPSNTEALATVLRSLLVWMGLSAFVCFSQWYWTGAKASLPLGGMCLFHYVTYLYSYLNLRSASDDEKKK